MPDGYYWYTPTLAEANDLRGLDHSQPVKVEDSEVALIQSEITHALCTFEGAFVPLVSDLERAVIEASIEWRSSWTYERETILRDAADALIAAREK